MTEMVCVSDTGGITPGCGGLYTSEQEVAWHRVVDFVHEHSAARIGVRLGHSGRKGSTKLMWDGIDEPLAQGNWEVCAPSVIPYSPANQTPRELTLGDLAEIKAQFVDAAARGGFDLLELHCAHGYLLSSFRSPLTNRRTDCYGGSVANRLRYPLEIFDAIREVWADDRADLGDRLARRRHRRRRLGGDRAGVRRALRGQHRRVHRSGCRRRTARVWAQLPSALCRADTQRGRPQIRCGGHRRRCDLVVRRRELDHLGRPGGSLRTGPSPSL